MRERRVDWHRLRHALRANALFSGATGAALIIARGDLAGEFSLGSWSLALLGAALVCFALSLVWLAGRSAVMPGLVRAVVAMDLGWVGGTAVALAVWGDPITGTGLALAIAVALAVGALALWQFMGLRDALASAR